MVADHVATTDAENCHLVLGPGANCADGGLRIDIGIDTDGDGLLEPSEVQQTAYLCSPGSPDADAAGSGGSSGAGAGGKGSAAGSSGTGGSSGSSGSGGSGGSGGLSGGAGVTGASGGGAGGRGGSSGTAGASGATGGTAGASGGAAGASGTSGSSGATGASGTAGASGGAGAAGATGTSGGAGASGAAGSGTTGPCSFGAQASGSSTDVAFTIKLPKGVRREDIGVGTTGGSLTLADAVSVVKDGIGFGSISSVQATDRTNLGVAAQVQDVYTEALGIDLRNNAHVHGTLATAADLGTQTGAVVDGSTLQNTSLQPLQSIDWTVSFPNANSGSCSLEPDNTEVIDPGSYGDVAIKSRSHLKVRSGTYYFNSLSFEPQAVMTSTTRRGRSSSTSEQVLLSAGPSSRRTPRT